jgi:uncharacterized protein YceK
MTMHAPHATQTGDHTMRKLMTIIVATAALAGSATVLSATAQPAAAQPMCQLPTDITIHHSNGWTVYVWVRDGFRYVQGVHGRTYMNGRIRYDSVRRDLVKFVITWNNGSAGVYTGTIDANGFVSGTTVDRWHPQSRAHWRLQQLASCTG